MARNLWVVVLFLGVSLAVICLPAHALVVCMPDTPNCGADHFKFYETNRVVARPGYGMMMLVYGLPSALLIGGSVGWYIRRRKKTRKDKMDIQKETLHG